MTKKQVRVARKKDQAAIVVKAKRTRSTAAAKEFAVPMFDAKGKAVGEYALDKGIFNGSVNNSVLYQAVLMYNANARQGNAATKTRADVSGGGKKPWRQKGTGRARAGSTRSPLWRGGGTVFGPHPRDYSYSMPKKVKRIAFVSSLNLKLIEAKVKGLDAMTVTEPKTKQVRAILQALKLGAKTLLVVDKLEQKLERAARNLQELTIRNVKDLNTMDVLRCDTLVFARPALEKLHERCA